MRVEMGTSATVSTLKIKKNRGRKKPYPFQRNLVVCFFCFVITVRISAAWGSPEPLHASD